MKRVEAGWYESADGMVTIQSHKIHDPKAKPAWNLVIDGRCDDAYSTLADAKRAATDYGYLR